MVIVYCSYSYFVRIIGNACCVVADKITTTEIYALLDQGHKFVAVVVKSRNLPFTATNREISRFPRQIVKLAIYRDKSRFLLFPATNRDNFSFL